MSIPRTAMLSNSKLSLMQMARLPLRDGEHLADEDRESRLCTLLHSWPASAEHHTALGTLLVRRREWPEAAEAFALAVAHAPKNPAYRYALAVSLEQLRQPDKAAKSYEHTIKLLDDNDENKAHSAIEERLRLIKLFCRQS